MEPIKQEIINNIFENGDKLITGPILQTVLIDMIDDVNVKDQEILSKTGSWDDAVTQIPNLATKEEVTNLSESVARDLENKAEETKTWVQNQGYLTEHQDISGLATKTELTEAENNLQTNITSLSESVARDLANVSVPEGVATEEWVQNQDYASKSYVDNAVSSSSVDLTGYATETWVESQGYLKEHQDISNLATKAELNSVSQSVQTDISNLATKGELNDTKSTLESNLNNLSSSVSNDIQNKGEEVKTWVQSQGYLTEHQDISNLATKSELTSVSESVQTDITNLSESVANSAVWKKGTGQDSIVQKLTGANEADTPIATGNRAIAIGYATTASGDFSHAGGEGTLASGRYSYTEGQFTTASGGYSHAEGASTKALEYCSHAEGEGTIASGHTSHAEGNSCQSPGQASHAEGGTTIASGWGSHAEGDHTKALEHCSHAEGNATTASAGTSHAEGSDTLTLGWSSHAEGQFTTASVHCSHAEGHRAEASGSWSHAEGNGTRTLEQCSHAEGNTTVALGSYSHAEGNYTTASGESSHAEGDQTTALGKCSHAEGYHTTATGNQSHAEGDTSNASGMLSHAEGQSTLSSGQASHAEGFFTVASNDYEHAQGKYNHNSTNQIFSVGAGEKIGETVTRRNAVSILEVPNSDTQVVTASVFVQNIGGYDGTNPEPGTNDLATVINGMSTGGGSSETLWKKGTEKDSIVQILTGDNEAYTPTATGIGAVAIGAQTNASGRFSHAEGSDTKALEDSSHAEGVGTRAEGPFSHAEGYYTTASGESSHAEGYQTVTFNSYECALGMCNHSSEGQIFSVGAGEGDPFNPFDPKPITRRNAISVLAVPNSDTQINTASVFVQNVGGYDGTNPTPGTNDLATVINSLSSSGGSSGGGESGNYLPLTGGTLTGDLQVNSSMGVGTGPQGTYCLAVGNSSTNTGGSHYALAVGENCQVKGAYGGVSLGRENVVNAAFGLATGFRCRTTAMSGYAGGCRSTASANFAFAAGFGAEATRVGQVVLGSYNELDPSGSDNSTGSYAVILANGKSSTWHQDRPGSITRSNGLAIKWDGGIDIKYRDSTITLQDKLNEIEAKISSGGTATSSETWTFTLEDGSTVTKNILMA